MMLLSRFSVAGCRIRILWCLPTSEPVLKVDYYLPPSPPGVAAELAQRAARIGFDGVFTAETNRDPFLPLVAAGAAAPDLELGTAIAVAFARSPMTVAHTAWDLAEMSDGRFLLGLGTQVRAHVTRRFSMPWSNPGPRMREYLAALRAIWGAWRSGEPLRFEGENYRFTLMTPFFTPAPIPHEIPLYIAGVGEYMCRLAGEVCDGFHVHPFHTRRYIDEVTLPAMAAGAAAAGRSLDDVERCCAVLVATGRSDAEVAAAVDAVRLQVAFYASTPAYRGVLETHGWEVGPRLSAMSRRGDWESLPDLVSDEMVREVAVVAPVDRLAAAIKARYAGILQRFGFYTPLPPDLDEEGWAGLVAEIQEG
jgi:probable F420-dependent oxidoreductase